LLFPSSVGDTSGLLSVRNESAAIAHTLPDSGVRVAELLYAAPLMGWIQFGASIVVLATLAALAAAVCRMYARTSQRASKHVAFSLGAFVLGCALLLAGAIGASASLAPGWIGLAFVSSGLLALPALVSLIAIMRPAGTMRRYSELMREVEHRTQVERELRSDNEQFQRAIDGSSDGFWEWNKSKRAVWYSYTFKWLLGYNLHEFPSSLDTFFDSLHPSDLPRVIVSLCRHLDGHEPYDVEYRLTTKSGEYRWFRARGKAFHSACGELEHMSGSIQDITSEKETLARLAESERSVRQKQRMEAVGALAGGIAHEFNNLLHVIQSYTEFAIDSVPKEGEAIDDLNNVLTSSKRAATLTRQLLDFSRSDEIKLQIVDVNNLIDDLLLMLQPLLGERIDLSVELCEDTPKVRGDAVMLQQSLLNLCINARDAMPAGGNLRIRTSICQLSSEVVAARIGAGQFLQIAVSDDGAGIPAAIIERIFDPFFTTKEVGKGTGMGLAIVHSTIEKHGGFVHVYSEPGVGTTFKLLIPLAECEQAADWTPDNDAYGDGELILVADDDAKMRDVAVRILIRAGYQVVQAVDGAQALEQVRRHQADLRAVLLDTFMPGGSGGETCRRIHGVCQDLPVIFCSGFDISPVKNDVLKLSKPYVSCDLTRTVRKAIDPVTVQSQFDL
jgi:PAS domain S-box-containing protein